MVKERVPPAVEESAVFGIAKRHGEGGNDSDHRCGLSRLGTVAAYATE